MLEQPIRLKHKGDELRKYFIKKQQLSEAELLKSFVDESSPGLSSLVGSDQLYKLAQQRSQDAKV